MRNCQSKHFNFQLYFQWIRIRITVKGRIRMRIIVASRIRIRIKVTSRIRIRSATLLFLGGILSYIAFSQVILNLALMVPTSSPTLIYLVPSTGPWLRIHIIMPEQKPERRHIQYMYSCFIWYKKNFPLKLKSIPTSCSFIFPLHLWNHKKSWYCLIVKDSR